MEDCQRSDLGLKGSKYIWCDKKMNHNFTKVRLDRVVAISGWCRKFKAVDVMVLAVRSYDRYPLLINYGSRG